MANLTMTPTELSPATAEPPKRSSRQPAPALLPVLSTLEARIRHHFHISPSPYDLRRPIYRSQPFRFLDLPGEVRERIYELTWATTGLGYYFSMRLCYPSIDIRRQHERGLPARRGTTLLRVSRQVAREAAHVLYARTPLHIDSAPYRRPPESLNFVGAVRTRWFMSTTRWVCIRSNFGFVRERNATWVKGLKCFEALLCVEILLDLDVGVEESRLKDLVANLVPFAALGCDKVTFRGPPYVEDGTKKEVELAWQEALEAEQTHVVTSINIVWDYMNQRSRRALEAQAETAQDQ